MKIFLDANILFSASQSRSATRLLFDALIKYTAICVTNPHALEEAKRNIETKRPRQISELKKLIKQLNVCHAFYSDLDINLHPQDVPILAGAIGSECAFLWTGDRKHFGKFYGQSVHGVLVVSHSMLADILFDMGWNPQ